MKYNIQWCEQKETSTGKKKLNATLKDEAGTVLDNVSIWADFPGFDSLMNGHDVEGDLVAAKDPKYGPTLYPIKKRSTTGNFGANKATQVAEAQARKEQSIEKAQDRAALMWAKYGASEIVAHHPAYKFLLKEQIPNELEVLSTKIYNGELTEPFSS